MSKKFTFKNKTIRTGLLSLTGMWLVLGILVVANVLSSYAFFRLDLTEHRMYSLSPASKKLLKELKEPIVIKGYFSKGLVPPYSTFEEYVKDLLDEYVAYSNGKVKFSLASYEDEEKFTEEARRAGIAPVRFTQIARDKYETREGYVGLVLRYEDKVETIPWIKDTSGIEYDLSSRIKKLAYPTQKSLAFVSSNDTLDILTDVPGLSDLLEKQYTIKRVDLDVPDWKDVSALFLIGPKTALTEKQILALDQALSQGIPTALFLDQQAVDIQTFTPRPNAHGLDNWLKAKGVTLKSGFVLDSQNQQITIQSRQGIFTFANIVQYPFFPLVTNLDKANPATKDVEQVTFPYVHPLEISTETAKTTVLAQSSPKSWYKEQTYNLSPFTEYFPEPQDLLGPFPLMVLLEGQWAVENSTPSGKFLEPSPLPKEGGTKTRVIVSGTSRLVNPELPISQTNFSLFLNLADYLAQDETLISIRSKGSTYRPLKDLSAPKRTLVKYADMLAMPLVVVAGGLFRWRRRKAQKQALAKEFQYVA